MERRRRGARPHRDRLVRRLTNLSSACHTCHACVHGAAVAAPYSTTPTQAHRCPMAHVAVCWLSHRCHSLLHACEDAGCRWRFANGLRPSVGSPQPFPARRADRAGRWAPPPLHRLPASHLAPGDRRGLCAGGRCGWEAAREGSHGWRSRSRRRRPLAHLPGGRCPGHPRRVAGTAATATAGALQWTRGIGTTEAGPRAAHPTLS